MSDPTDQDQVHEGTRALQEIADEVEAEREQAGRKASLPDDDTPEDDSETREDHEDEDDVPLAGANGEVPGGVYSKLSRRGGGPQL